MRFCDLKCEIKGYAKAFLVCAAVGVFVILLAVLTSLKG